MNIHKFRGVLIAVSVAILSTLTPASAQEWPTRNITVVVPLGAGSASDIMARVVMEQVGERLGQTVVIENRPGAGGTIGANQVGEVGAGRLHCPGLRGALRPRTRSMPSCPTIGATISSRSSRSGSSRSW